MSAADRARILSAGVRLAPRDGTEAGASSVQQPCDPLGNPWRSNWQYEPVARSRIRGLGKAVSRVLSVRACIEQPGCSRS